MLSGLFRKSVWLLALGEAESGAGRNLIDFRIRPFHSIRVGWSWRIPLPTCPTRSMLPSALSSVLLEAPSLKAELVVEVVELGVLSWAPEGQGIEVAVEVLVVEAGSRRLTPDVETGFAMAMPV